jgi:hypothetical protein
MKKHLSQYQDVKDWCSVGAETMNVDCTIWLGFDEPKTGTSFSLNN